MALQPREVQRFSVQSKALQLGPAASISEGLCLLPPHGKPDFSARQGDAMKFREEEQNKGEVHACVCIEHLLQTLPPAFHMKSSELPIHYYQRSCWIWMIARSLPLPESQNIRGVIHLMP